MWGPYAVDYFAHIDYTQLPKSYSRFWCPGAAATDAFTVNWWVPPFSLIGRVLRYATACNAMGSLIVPVWKSASFWPLLCPDGSQCVCMTSVVILTSVVSVWVYMTAVVIHLVLGGLKYIIRVATTTLVVTLTSVVSVCVHDFGGHIVTGMGWPQWSFICSYKSSG